MTPKNEIIKIITDNSHLFQFQKGKSMYELGEGDVELVAELITKKFKL